MMRITFLGTGTSCGVPTIGCHCHTCSSTDPRDKRLRCSALVETEQTRILIDCGPDFRQQILPMAFRKIDGVLVTHAHYDHVGGMDDLRPFCQFGAIDVYANEQACSMLMQMMPYCFAEHRYPGVPAIGLHRIVKHQAMTIGDIDVMPVEVMHGRLPILGFRFTQASAKHHPAPAFTYITDMKTIGDEELPFIEHTEVLVVNALRYGEPHHSHQLVDDAISFARRTDARRTLLIHSDHHIGRHGEVNSKLPEGIEMAFDGQQIDI